jgi:hypothetical protein
MSSGGPFFSLFAHHKITVRTIGVYRELSSNVKQLNSGHDFLFEVSMTTIEFCARHFSRHKPI